MNIKKWIKTYFSIVSIIIFISIFNYIVDPYQQYRITNFYPLPYEKERELDAGMAKNFQFDSVVLGTSMMQNFSLKHLQKELDFTKPIKLTLAGSSIYEQSVILKTAIKHQKIKNVLIGIDFFSYYGDIKRLKHGENNFPFYLYDDNFLNDYKYLSSFDTLKRSIKLLSKEKSKTKNNPLYNYYNMYEWHGKHEEKDTLNKIKDKWLNRDKFDNEAKHLEKKFIYLKNNFDYNLKPLLKENKNINFIIIFPPYSILAYKVYQQRGELEDFLKFKQYIIVNLSKFKNVEVYDFGYDNSISYNLHNYYDLYHYNKKISNWMISQIKLKKYLTKKEKEIKSNIFLKDVEEYIFPLK